MRIVKYPFGLLLVLFAAMFAEPSTYAFPSAANLAPVVGTKHSKAIKHHYIVVLHDTATQAARSSIKALVQHNGGTIDTEYTHVLEGFAATLPVRAVEALRSSPHVKYIEQDRNLTASIDPPSLTQRPSDTTQTSYVPWGLDRIDERDSDGKSSYEYAYIGSGVDVYVFDTGIYAGHSQFGERVQAGWNFISDSRTTTTTCNGHGTHVAGIIGGSYYGVAKGVRIYPVRVIDCAGDAPLSVLLNAANKVIYHHSTSGRPAVANMSLNDKDQAADDANANTASEAIKKLIDSGIMVVVSAGNNGTATNLPARVKPTGCYQPWHEKALIVGSIESNNARASSSNYGSCLTLFAPGANILSLGVSSNTSTATMSGTSMAAPHVTGAVALYLAHNPSASVDDVRNAIINNASINKVTSPGANSPNRLLFKPTDW